MKEETTLEEQIAKYVSDKMPTFRQAILAKKPRTVVRLVEHTMARGGKYRDAYDWFADIFMRAGRQPPSIAEFDELIREGEAIDG